MQEVSAIYTIRSKYNTLSAKEKKIADFILEHPKESVNPSIEKLAERIGISESTMVRFARKLGYSGYQRFRIALARETIPKNEQVFETELLEGEDVVGMVFKNAQRTLSETLEAIDRKAIKESAILIAKARSVFLMGLGGSNTLAQDAYHKFIRTGINCQYAADFHMQLMLASQATEEDVALIVSHTGEGYDTLALAEELRNNGAKLLILTSNARSPLAKLGDYVLSVSPCCSKIVAESFSARITSLVLIDVLYVEILELMENTGVENLNKMRDVIAKRRI
ncbi:MurR/RpiR family transcriptional regulator [uncultured Sphaerochaeta sp.]|uniref:MurR/RpiR family transcriptional regulator n=1 Tax=uncultured Sphaerochaeta sp. TaxID=886478 RepID=UPI002AA6B4D6|nr:MurR/RpiR family transcriptional regulator [uncultured Sphaerochaeta sp.]